LKCPLLKEEVFTVRRDRHSLQFFRQVPHKAHGDRGESRIHQNFLKIKSSPVYRGEPGKIRKKQQNRMRGMGFEPKNSYETRPST
jgi:DUF1365 family protein